MIKNIVCHIVGLNPSLKNKLIKQINKKIYTIIDLDEINNLIITDPYMIKLFTNYTNLKENKNDKYKETDKKMTQFWEANLSNLIDERRKNKSKVILLGNSNHYRSLSKKVKIETANRFIIKSAIKKYVREIIRYNIENHKDEIIDGAFPIDYLNFDYLVKKNRLLNESYTKIGYLPKNLSQIIKILQMIPQKKYRGVGLFVSVKQPYNVNSKIYPKKNSKIMAYSEPVLALLGSFRWKDDELVKSYDGNNVKLIEKKKGALERLNSKRFLYLVEDDPFIPHEKGKNIKFFSQSPIVIIDKEKITNVYDKLKELNVIH